MKKSIAILIFVSFAIYTLNAGSYMCHFTKKISYSSKRDKTPNRIRKVNLKVIYRVVGDELLTKPVGVDRTYNAYSVGKFLDRDGTLYFAFESNKGYMYAITEDFKRAIEMTPSGKTVLKAYCYPF